MPEGPEVAVMTKQLNELLLDKQIIGFQLHGNQELQLQKSIRNIFQGIVPIKCVGVRKKGKFMYLMLENNIYVGVHLGLSGHWVTSTTGAKATNITVAEFIISSADILPFRIFYNDVRHFGKFTLLTREELIKNLDSLGPDIIEATPRPGDIEPQANDIASALTNMDFLIRIKKHSKKQIVQVLMDQNILSGVGNYIKAESLYAAQVNPAALIENISDEKLIILLNQILRIAKESYDLGGVSVRDYKDVYGKRGTFTLQIYKKTRDHIGNIVKRVLLRDGRATYYVPAIQGEIQTTSLRAPRKLPKQI